MRAAEWTTDVIDAVERWISLTDGPSEAPTWSTVGRATPRGDGWLVVDLRDGASDPETLVDPCFAGEHGPDREPAHPVDEIRHEDGLLLLREPPGLPDHSHRLWVRSMSRRFVLEKLVAGLRAAGRAPLAEAMAQKRTAGPPTSDAEATGLLGAQVEAFRACLSPGVRLVWGPPGTGTTRVLARAIEELVRQDKRVLLVSTTDAAIDSALHAVVRRMSPQPGVAVKVGLGRLEGTASADARRLAATASREADEAHAAVVAELGEIEAIDARINDLRAELGDHDEPAYRAAAARLAAEREVEELRPRLPESEAAADSARKAALAAATELQEALTAAAELDRVRDALEHERSAVAGLAVLEQRLQDLRAARAALEEETPPSGWAARRRYRRDADAADAELRRFIAVASDGRRRWLDAQLRARAIIGQLSQADVDRADRRAAHAEDALAAADQEYRLSRDALADLRSAVAEAEAVDRPSEQDRRLVAEADAQDLPARHAELQELLARQRINAELRGPLERKYRTLVDKARAQRANAEAGIVRNARVVATTLAGSRVHSALTRESFDVVLVDGAGAAPLAEVLLALCRATTTAVVFGDFRQAGPVLENAVRHDAGPAVQRWVANTCFSHVGIESPADVEKHDGCVALTHGFRSGPGLRRLANDAVHELLRDAEEFPGVSWRPSTGIALIDASTVLDLAAVRPGAVGGSWWTAGAVLARALAGAHLPDGPVGVVTPYPVQADATPAALQGRDLIVGVGTPHSFRGHGYPALVLDLVEGGHGRDGDGLRVVGSEIIRAQVWSAGVLLSSAGPAPVDPTFRDLRARLQRPATVTDAGDGPAFGRELEGHLAVAQRPVWMWAPWGAGRAVVPLLRPGARRGVRGGVFARPDEGVHPSEPASRRRLPVLLGSGNVPLSAARPSRENMIVVVGQAFARRLLDGLHATTIGPPRACGGEPVEVRHGHGRAADLHWRCSSGRLWIPRQRTSSGHPDPRCARLSPAGGTHDEFGVV